MEFRVERVSEAPDRSRVAVSGDLDLDSAPQLGAALLAASGAVVEVDLARVTFIDSQGVNALVQARRRLEARGAQLVCTGASARVRRLLELLQLGSLLEGS